MGVEISSDIKRVDWALLNRDLTEDDFNNGRTDDQLRLSFENSQVMVFAFDDHRCIGTARALSDWVCNTYVVDVWTQSNYRRQGIATEMMATIIAEVPGQHVYLFTDDQVDFYKRLGFRERPVGLEKISGEWLQNSSRDKPD